MGSSSCKRLATRRFKYRSAAPNTMRTGRVNHRSRGISARRDDAARGELGNEPVVEIQVVREPVEQHDGRLIARMVACVDVM